MRPPLRYLDWAKRWYGQVTYDLASSGIAAISSDDLFALDPGGAPKPDDFGHTERFCALVAERYGVPESHVCPTLGTSGGLFATYGVLIEPGDDVVVESPTYPSIQAVAAGLGARVRTFERRPDASFALEVDAILAEVRPGTRLCAVTNPQNPGGVQVSDESIADLARGLHAKGVTLVIDEVYREFTMPGTTAYSLGPNICVSSSLTKRFGLGWARAGWAILPPPLAERAHDLVGHTCGVPPPWHAGLGAFALARLGPLVERTRRLQAGKRHLVEAFAATHADKLTFTPPSGEMPFAFFRHRQGEDLLARIEAGIATEGVIVAPGSFFGCPAGFRLSFTAPAERVAEGLSRLERVLDL
jgi:aspartate/methionine/tyrosine aminotransferase